MLSYEQYPEEKSRLWLSSLKKKLINLHRGLLDVTKNIYPEEKSRLWLSSLKKKIDQPS